MVRNRRTKTVAESNKRLKRSVFSGMSFRQRVASNGVNPNPVSYMTINDAGKDVYVRTLTLDKIPRSMDFAGTFAELFRFPGATTSVFIEPMLEGRASKHVDKHVLEIETELAGKNKSRNEVRKLNRKLGETEAVAEGVESGKETLFEVSFLTSIYAESLDKLNILTTDLVALGKRTGMEFMGVYSMQPEAYLSNGPFNRTYKGKVCGLEFVNSVKKHIMKRSGVLALYNHTDARFFHKNGVPLGRRMGTNELMTYDPWDVSHTAYNAVFAGATGTGKSSTAKMIGSRLEALGEGCRYAIIDTDQVGVRGEYTRFAEGLGGVVYTIGTETGEILNPFDIDEQKEYDKVTGTEFRVLRLRDKIKSGKRAVMSMVQGTAATPDFVMASFLDDIISEALSLLYEEKGIIDGEPDSIYEPGEVFVDGKLTSGMKRKDMPTFSDLYLKVLQMRKEDEDPFHAEAYSVLCGKLKQRVNVLYYDKETLRAVDKEEYLEGIDSGKYVRVKGTEGYYDGQSTIRITRDVPAIDIDVSGLPEDERPIAQQIALSWVEENFVKKNSENEAAAGKAIVIVDEAHRMFPYAPCRKYLTDFYRTARKRNVAVWTLVQSMLDFKLYADLFTIIENAPTKFLFKHTFEAAEFVKKVTPLTDSQLVKLTQIGGNPNDPEDTAHKGEVCMIDADRVAFLAVDYLIETEWRIAESDMNKIRDILAAQRQAVA